MAHPGHHALERPDDVALVISPSGVTVTWAELRRRIVQAANALHDLGVRPGDPVAFCVENRVEFAVLVWACLDAGFRYTPVSTRLTADEVAYIVGDCGAKVFVHTAHTASSAASVTGVRVVDLDDGDPLGTGLDEPPRYERVEGVAMLYSSGTTGRPKGVWRPAPPEPIEELPPGDRMSAMAYGITQASVYLSPAPLYHSAPLTFLVQMGRIGAATVVMERFDPSAALECIERHRVTHSQWVPTMFSRLLALSDDVRAAHDLSSQRCAIHAGAPCPPSVKRAMIDWWGPILHEYYSGTESVGFTHITAPEWLARPGSVGRAFGCTIHIVGEDGREAPPGVTGTVYFEGKTGLEYHNDPEKTRGALDERGWTTMGDIGHVDDEGFLFLTDRRNFTIISGGVNVYPSEVEAALIEHPEVRDCAVFGLPDPDLGEVVAVLVESDAAQGPHDAELARRIAADIAATLAGPKRPRLWRFDSVGRTETGKIHKQKLRDASREAGRMIDLRTSVPAPGGAS